MDKKSFSQIFHNMINMGNMINYTAKYVTNFKFRLNLNLPSDVMKKNTANSTFV